MDISPYTPSQLKEAMDSLNQGSSNPSFDARHIYGYGDDDHKLSMLQTVTATTLLDYRAKLVRAETRNVVHVTQDFVLHLFIFLHIISGG